MTDELDSLRLDVGPLVWPPVLPPTGRTNTTTQLDAHPDDHNKAAQALADIVAKIGTLPLGRIAYQFSTATTASIGTAYADVVVCPWTAVAGRRYRVSGLVIYTGTAAVGTTVAIRDGSNVNLEEVQWSVGGASYSVTATIWVEVPPGAAGARTAKLAIASLSAGPTLSLLGSATRQHQLIVEDIGT